MTNKSTSVSAGREQRINAWDGEKFTSWFVLWDGVPHSIIENCPDVNDFALGEALDWPIVRSTGLFLNGKELWEGDIIEFNLQDGAGRDYFYKSAVRFLHGSFVLDTDTGFVEDLRTVIVDDEEPKKIGNIFENPELLK